MNFDKRIQRAIHRGQQGSVIKSGAPTAKPSSARQHEKIHTEVRDELIEHLDYCLASVAKHFPEFRVQTIVSENGWGTRMAADHAAAKSKKKTPSAKSFFEILVPPLQDRPVIELKSRATILDQEVFLRTHYQPLDAIDFTSLARVIEKWCLDFVESYVTLA